ncbi:MAG: FecR domain-containing protein [Acidobacteria bacterium]|nr:FecR domain-containing protein [Acidobacteriota bacterium]
MFGQHVTKNLSAYAHGETPVAETERVAEHLRACAPCRKEFEEIKFGIRLAESLAPATAPASLWEGVEAALIKHDVRTKQHAAVSLERRPFFASGSGWRRAAYACGVLCLCVLAGAAWFFLRPSRSTWEVARLEGAPRIDADRIGDRGRLAVGEWLETDANSRAQIEVSNIGQVEVEPNTRLRLVETKLTEHRLELARGTMHAKIWAPPRLFFVNTPSAVAADLGCAYTLEVDDRGRSLLHVTSGWVALETPGRESMVPAGAACVTQPGAGPGTPFFEDAPDALVEALKSFDFQNGGGMALDAVLSNARTRDTLTLWHLLSRAEGDERSRVYERLSALAPTPEGVTKEGVMRLDAGMLAAWKDRLEDTWADESMHGTRKAWRKLWK